MKQRITLPKDESIHRSFDGEWWYFNGFLKGKHRYAFMTCLFRVKGKKVRLPFLKVPVKELFFSHSILYDLENKKIIREMLPIVVLSEDSFQKKDLFINYYFPLRKNFTDYEISRQGEELRIKNRFMELSCRQTKKPLLEGGAGFMNYGREKTYYYTYSNLEAAGVVGKDMVKGKVWHDRQWFNLNSVRDDTWVWFSVQMFNNTELVCCNFKGKKFAYILHPDSRQESSGVSFKPTGNIWKSPISGLSYNLEWEIKLKNYIIKTRPMIKECEMNFGIINYWEGPVDVRVNGKKAQGFMEYILPNQPSLVSSTIKKGEQELLEWIKQFKV